VPAEDGHYVDGEPLGHAELLAAMAGAGVERAILVPPTWAEDGNAVALEAARRHPGSFGVMGKLGLRWEVPEQSLEDWRATPGMLGIRVILSMEADRAAFDAGRLEWMWQEAERAQVPIMVYPPGLIDQIAQVAEAHPGLRLIVDHCGAPVTAGMPGLIDAVGVLNRHAHLANLAVKASVLPLYSDKTYPFPDVQRAVTTLIEGFGPDRVFWGSDFTRGLGCSYAQSVAMMTDDFPGLQGHDLDLVMGEGLSRWLDWPASCDGI
jgi:predicted TIM-barrel fold metal-dependent hydrolase